MARLALHGLMVFLGVFGGVYFANRGNGADACQALPVPVGHPEGIDRGVDYYHHVWRIDGRLYGYAAAEDSTIWTHHSCI